MKKIGFLAIAAAIVLGFASCTTSSPLAGSTSFPAGREYKILGRVTVTASRNQSGFLKLLEAAKKQFPNADDVVNIVIDSENGGDMLTMSGIAIDYMDM